ncbi:MAG TPA: CRISPR-associated protein Csx19 [Petrotogaceae bacterium]|nr:CRISPR-associated protein Csx19 [Petrotogaceae bacterium]
MKITTIKTTKETKELTQEQIIPEINQIFQDKTAYVLQYTSHSVDIGYIKNNTITLYKDQQFIPSDFTDVRIFNEEMELHILKKKEKTIARLRKDGQGEDTDIFDQKVMLLGETQKILNEEWTEFSETRGASLILPLKDAQAQNTFYKARNYIQYTNDGELCFKDARLCGFYNTNEEKIRSDI